MFMKKCEEARTEDGGRSSHIVRQHCTILTGLAQVAGPISIPSLWRTDGRGGGSEQADSYADRTDGNSYQADERNERQL